VDSKASMLKKGRNWLISASGGVAIRPSNALAKAEKSNGPVAARAKSIPADSGQWWWN
jgi:hypothetical protein